MRKLLRAAGDVLSTGRRQSAACLDVDLRMMSHDEVDAVWELWAENAREHFSEVLSYDRWGPGVPVPHDDHVDEAPTQFVDPSLSVRKHLESLVDAPAGFVLLALSDGQAAGFVVTSLRPAAPATDDTEGFLDELYVLPRVRRHGIGTRLVTEAVAVLRERGATMFRAEVRPDWADAVRFWERQPGWHYDARRYRCYD